MNRLPLINLLPRWLVCLVALVFVTAASPAHAVNDWYKMGYSEGYLHQERLCQQQMQRQVRAQFDQLATENQRLRQELIRLRQQLDGQQVAADTQNASAAAAQNVQAVQPQDVPSQYFAYPNPQTPDGVRDDSLPRNAANTLDADNNDGG